MCLRIYDAIGCEPPLGNGGYDLGLRAEMDNMDRGVCPYPFDSVGCELEECRATSLTK
jgi:hypothetical protein